MIAAMPAARDAGDDGMAHASTTIMMLRSCLEAQTGEA
jgi:hypothetical protein